jgi:hypothetical protein
MINKKRFALKVLSNPNRANSMLVPHQIPTQYQIDEMEKYNIPLDVDKELRKSVIDLNKAGFKTEGSCTGHGEYDGYITFPKLLTDSERNIVQGILRRNNIVVRKFSVSYGKMTLGRKLKMRYPAFSKAGLKTIKRDYDFNKKYGNVDVEKDLYGLTAGEIKKANKVADLRQKGEEREKLTVKAEKAENDAWIAIAEKAINEGDTTTAHLVGVRIKKDLAEYDYLLKNRKYTTPKGRKIGIKLRDDLRNKACALKIIRC